MKISGVMPLRNAVKLQYPFEPALRSLRALCDEVVVLVDPTSEDGTLEAVNTLGVADKIVESSWDMSNHKGHTNCEISVQTQKACDAATGDWIFSLQADEVLHEYEIRMIQYSAVAAEASGFTGIEFRRLYFYGSLAQYREDWTIPLLRFFKRGRWRPDVDGAMRFDPVDSSERRTTAVAGFIYHYSRVGDPKAIAERVRNLDGFFHESNKIALGEIAPYDFNSLRKLDTYVVGHQTEIAPEAKIVPFRVEDHPQLVRDYFHV